MTDWFALAKSICADPYKEVSMDPDQIHEEVKLKEAAEAEGRCFYCDADLGCGDCGYCERIRKEMRWDDEEA